MTEEGRLYIAHASISDSSFLFSFQRRHIVDEEEEKEEEEEEEEEKKGEEKTFFQKQHTHA